MKSHIALLLFLFLGICGNTLYGQKKNSGVTKQAEISALGEPEMPLKNILKSQNRQYEMLIQVLSIKR